MREPSVAPRQRNEGKTRRTPSRASIPGCVGFRNLARWARRPRKWNRWRAGPGGPAQERVRPAAGLVCEQKSRGGGARWEPSQSLGCWRIWRMVSGCSMTACSKLTSGGLEPKASKTTGNRVREKHNLGESEASTAVASGGLGPPAGRGSGRGQPPTQELLDEIPPWP